MAPTLVDLDRRVTALEKAAEREQTLERAVAEIVSESERRVQSEIAELRHEMSALRTELRVEITEEIRTAKRDTIDLLNDRFDQVMTALDRPKNSPD